MKGNFKRPARPWAGSDSFFRKAFGPRKWWKQTREYLSDLLVQSRRRNAETPPNARFVAPGAASISLQGGLER